MEQLLLPYAYDKDGNLVHIDDAIKGENYTCPNCGAELLLKISRKKQGEKYYRRNHFAHKGNMDNYCSESFLHKSFKRICAEYIREKILAKSDMFFEWECQKCREKHTGNLLKKAVGVVEECDLGECKPDIALLDSSGKVIIVIEIVYTHRPEKVAMQYYEENKIACLQIEIDDFEDCKNVEDKLSHPSNVNLCVNPICPRCGKPMNSPKLVTVVAKCYQCSNDVRVAMKVAPNSLQSPKDFSEEEVEIARSLGAKIELRYSQTRSDNYYANVCEHCNAFIGDFYMYEYYHLPHENEVDLEYVCFGCAEEDARLKHEAELAAIQKKRRGIEELRAKNVGKLCPECGKMLRLRKSYYGDFWGCEGYPQCNHIEDIKDEDLNL